MGRKSREKGKRGEREACDEMRSLWPDVRRKAMQSRGGGEGADLENTPGFHVEVGIGRAVSPHAKLAQAERDCRAFNVIPIALTKRDRGEWMVSMHAEDFRLLVERGSVCPTCNGRMTIDDPPFAADPKRVPCPKCAGEAAP